MTFRVPVFPPPQTANLANVFKSSSVSVSKVSPDQFSICSIQPTCMVADIVPAPFLVIASLHKCTATGRTYYDEENDFRLEIPEGAIPMEQSITIDIGVALHGPFQYPEGVRPVSPVFWICVRGREDFHFLKPVKITLEHCLILDRETDIQSLGLTFLKAGHSKSNEHKFGVIIGKANISSSLTHCSLEISHFCSVCLSCNVSVETAKKLGYCLTLIHPELQLTADKPRKIYFFATFALKYCFKTVSNIISKKHESKTYTIIRRRFQFRNNDIRINISEHSDWMIFPESAREVTPDDIDFHKYDSEHRELEDLESLDFYPPRIVVSLSGSGVTQQGMATFRFDGTIRELQFQLGLYPCQDSSPAPSPGNTASPSSIPKPSESITNPPTLRVLVNEVAAYVPKRWQDIGIQLDIDYDELQQCKCTEDMDSLIKVFVLWKRHDNPPYTWETLINILKKLKEVNLVTKLLEKLS